MAKPLKPKSKAKSKTLAATDPNHPESWLYLLSENTLTFGVLRSTFKDRTNSAVEFGRRKLQPVQPPPTEPDAITAERVDVILPEGAEDQFATSLPFLEGCDEMQVNPAILVYLTIPTPDVDRMHHAWEKGRAFARILADERGLATLLIQHAPGRISSPNQPHLHLLICPRRTAKAGLRYGGLDNELLYNDGARVLAERWAEFTEAGS
ncbi:hypothetical protein GRI55_14610 [Erythrobacter citreus]|uniref:Uncharacterized protein n=1 Tax=Qipengyuania citrea TaxID=225971 RepID=A0A6I4UI31_9SPHN|nr:hypothetical protein [Qipengyuania citrea]MDQ0567199.1 hypothetical protein [Qipengyuania citrea]MXP36963.1 hypothetical protein [Qipengyuania citrea]|tara:strand:+ start:1566 stop:2189 length:624 start_codon:yes stop_codon:yes gene_type:complete